MIEKQKEVEENLKSEQEKMKESTEQLSELENEYNKGKKGKYAP